MKQLIKALLFSVLLSSMFTSSSLSDLKVFQKRKYTKGYHVDFRTARPQNGAESVTALTFKELKSDDKVSKVSTKEIQSIVTKQGEPSLIIASVNRGARISRPPN